MNDSNLASLIPAWLSATTKIGVPTPSPPRELHRRVRELRTQLRSGGNCDTFDASGDGPEVLSRLCFDLTGSNVESPEIRLREAAAAYDLVSDLTWPNDEFGEQNEILCNLALIAWRISRQIAPPEAAPGWERKFQAAFSRHSVWRESLQYFLATPTSDRSNQLNDEFLSDVTTVLAICELLRECREVFPPKAAEESSLLHSWIAETRTFGFGDERSYLLGVTALIAASAYRFLGQRDSSSRWLAEADSQFKVILNPEPELARLSYARLALCYEMRQYECVVETMPYVLGRFEKLGMGPEVTKCRYLEGMALKESGRRRLALGRLIDLRGVLLKSDPCSLLGAVLARIGELYSAKGCYGRAMQLYREALPLVRKSGRLYMVAECKCLVGETFRNMGQLEAAIDMYREAISDYATVGMSTFATYMRVVLAETLLLAGQRREAEIEILAALPTIEEQKMLQEGLAAVALLRESVGRCEPNESALRQVREHLKGGRR